MCVCVCLCVFYGKELGLFERPRQARLTLAKRREVITKASAVTSPRENSTTRSIMSASSRDTSPLSWNVIRPAIAIALRIQGKVWTPRHELPRLGIRKKKCKKRAYEMEKV